MINSKQIITAVFLILSAGCAPSTQIVPVKISTVRGPIQGTEVVNLQVSREQYKNAINNKKTLDSFRLVELMTHGKDSEKLPEHRLFSISKGSAPDLLGLQNADVLVAANDFVIHNPAKFKQYLILLQNEKTADIEVRREDRPVIFKYTFLD